MLQLLFTEQPVGYLDQSEQCSAARPRQVFKLPHDWFSWDDDI